MRRRITLIVLIMTTTLLLLALGGWAYIYTQQEQVASLISNQLSRQLNTQVTVQKPVLGFHPAPTLDIENIQLNMSDKKLKIHIKKLQIGFSWRNILVGRFSITNLDMIQPDIEWTSPSETDNSPRQNSSLTMIGAISSTLHHVRIVGGSLHLHKSESGDRVDPNSTWQIQNLNLNLNNGTLDDSQRITLDGQIIQQQLPPALFSLQGQLSQLKPEWTDTQIQLSANIQNILSQQIAPDSPYQASGPLNVQLSLRGQLGAEMAIQAILTPTKNEAVFIVGTETKYPLHRLELKTTAQVDSSQLQFNNMDLNYNDISVTGSLWVDQWKTEPQLHTNLRSGTISLNQVQPWLPESIIKHIPTQLKQATLQCQRLLIDGPLTNLTLQHVVESEIQIKHPQLSIQDVHGTDVTATMIWKNNQLDIHTTPLTFKRNKMLVQGPIHIGLTQEANKVWAVTANISPWAINLADAIKKGPDEAGSLRLQIQAKDSGNSSWQINDGELKLPGYLVLFSATHTDKNLFQVDLNVPSYQLETLSAEIPILRRMELKGEVSVHYSIEKQQGQPATGSGDVQLNDCAISPTFVIAPIHHINGTITLKDFSAQAPMLSLMLGDSPMTADAYIDDLRHPVAEIHATGDGVIARDLVFNSPQIRLNNLDGRIAIHAKGIDFIAASVDLEQGTHATVDGKLLFKGPLLELDIEAPYANINEIISLWSDQSTKPNNSSAHHRTATRNEFIHITAHVNQGVISGFEFQQARGTIHYKTGQLRVEPLHFRADKGTGTGSIYVIRNSGTTNNSLLKIEGTLSEINTDKVYQQLIQHIGLTTGSLNGYFTIQGPIGSQFLAQSQGNFHLDIKKGVLRKFKTLSKAFSILNVAQLFSLKLPDMDREGMPFNRLTADIALDRGILYSENLVINSPAMGVSVIGNHNLTNQNMDLIMGIKPLGTVDTLVTHIPVAGWLLAGEERAIITTHFKVSGHAADPTVEMLPLSSISSKVFNIFKRTLKLPGTLITDPKKILINPKD